MIIETAALTVLCKNLGRKLRQKNREPRPLQSLLVVLWISCEAIGLYLGYRLANFLNPGDNQLLFMSMLGIALCFVTAATYLVFQIANSLKPVAGTSEEERDR
jgi:hypothetical protein